VLVYIGVSVRMYERVRYLKNISSSTTKRYVGWSLTDGPL
jgi:hypothetical protein